MIDKIKEYISEAQGFSSQDPAELEAFRIKFLGSKFSTFSFIKDDQILPRKSREIEGVIIQTSFIKSDSLISKSIVIHYHQSYHFQGHIEPCLILAL